MTTAGHSRVVSRECPATVFPGVRVLADYDAAWPPSLSSVAVVVSVWSPPRT